MVCCTCFFHLCQFIFPWLQCRLGTKLFLWGERLRSEEVLREVCCGLYFKPDGHYMKIRVLFCNGREEIYSASTLLVSLSTLVFFSLMQSQNRAMKWGLNTLIRFLGCATLWTAVPYLNLGLAYCDRAPCRFGKGGLCSSSTSVACHRASSGPGNWHKGNPGNFSY